MENYRYHIVTPLGRRKKGFIKAFDRRHAMDALKVGGNTVISLEKPGIWDAQIDLPFGRRIKARDMSVFCRQFEAIVGAGIGIGQALNILTEQTENKRLKEALDEIRSYVERGESLSQSLSRRKDVFPDMLVHLVEAGEGAGKIEKSLERMAVHYERTVKIENLVAKAMIYPVILTAASIGVLFIMMIYIVPLYSSMLEDLGAELPFYTKLVVEISSFMVGRWYLILIWIGLLIAGGGIFFHMERGRYILSGIILKIPLFGSLKQKNASSRFARNLSTLLGAGAPVIEALEITADTMDDPLFKAAVKDMKDRTVQGIPLGASMKESRIFPSMVCHMVSVGEESGRLVPMLDSLAKYYEEETEAAAEKMTAALEPCIIIVMAAVVIAVVMAVYSPMLAMYQNLG